MGLTLFNESENNYFRHLVLSMMETRTQEGIIRPDMIHLLMEAKKGQLKYEETSKLEDTGFATVEESDVGTDRKRKVGKCNRTENLDTREFFFPAILYNLLPGKAF